MSSSSEEAKVVDEILLLLIKNPILGKAKTRVAQDVGDQRALEIYRELLTKTREESEQWEGIRHLYYSHFIDSQDEWSPDHFTKFLQPAGDLGARLTEAFRHAFEQGARRVCVIGSDCYALTTDLLSDAFQRLKSASVVIGPATDGGYYLMGMNTYLPELFQDIDWSTDRVTDQTLEKIAQLNLSFQLLTELSDVDHYSDWVNIKRT